MKNHTASTPAHDKLLRIYELYAAWAGDFDFACTEGCSTCCTRSVTMTTLEGEAVLDFIRVRKPELLALLDALPESTSDPDMTTNRFAAACLRGEEIEDTENWDFAPCFFLENNRCTIYPVRPFMCRSFGSRERCDLSGAANVAPLFLTVNTVVMQCIEHLDRGRPWGNMETILRYLATDRKPENQVVAEPIPGWLIPPGEEDLIRPRLAVLLRVLNGK